MRYLTNRAIYHITFFDKAIKDGVIDLDFLSVCEGIVSLYNLNEIEKRRLFAYWDNEEFSVINTSQVARFHLEFLDKMEFKSKLFGCAQDERCALQNKLEALQFYEKLQGCDSDIISAFEQNIDRKEVCVCFSLMHYFRFGSIPDRLIAKLRKNVLVKDFPDFDSLILLLKIDRNNMYQYKNILEQSSFKFYNFDFERLNQKYFSKMEKAENDSGKIS